MSTPRVMILSLTALEAGWMAFDGVRALVVGSFVTPREGPYAGQVGPWRIVVGPLGLDPNGTVMHWIFAAYGLLWLAAGAGFAVRRSWAWAAMLAAAIGSLWFLPFGTVLSVIQVVLLLLWRGRLSQSRHASERSASAA